MTVNLLIMI